jgi:hypothetical protein
MHDRWAPQGASAPHVAPDAPFVPHTFEPGKQTSPCPQLGTSAHESPAFGGVAHVPHAVFDGMAQKPVMH